MSLPIDKDVVVNTDADACGGVAEPQKCNYIGGEDADISAQREELAPIGVSIQPEGEANYCSYVAGDKFVKQVEFPRGYAVRDGIFYQDARFVYFNRGDLSNLVAQGFSPAKFPESFARYEIENRTASRKVEVTEFFTIEARDAGFLGDDDNQLSARETLLNYIKEKWPNAEIIDVDLRMDGTVSNHRKYIIYIAGYNLPKPAETATGGAKIPAFATEYCPEWALHTKNVTGEISLDGWEMIRSPLTQPSPQRGEGSLPANGVAAGGEGATYLAIPRQELKEELGGKLNRTELYAYDLGSKLGGSEYMKGDNPIRLLKEITFIGADGVVGLECPVFEVKMLEIPKTEDNCLEWVMREKEDAVRARKKVVDIGGGYLLANGGGGYKYIAPTGKMDVEAVKAALSRKIPDIDGYDKTIIARQVKDDPVCSAFELKPAYTKLPELQPGPATARRGGDDLNRLQKRFYDNPNTLVKLNRLGRLGDVIWARTKRPDEPAKNLIDLITNVIHEDEPVQKLEVAFTADQSGSMGDDAERVADEFGAIETELMQSAEDSDISLARFRDVDIEVVVHFEKGRPVSEGAREVINGLREIAKNIGGGAEYFCDAVDLVLDDFEKNGTPEGKKKIILITDEHGNLENADKKEGGKTPEDVKARADALGVEIKIVFIADAGSDGSTPLQAYFKYLDDNKIDIARMTEEERIELWGKMIRMADPSFNDHYNYLDVYLVALERLVQVSPKYRQRAVDVISRWFDDSQPYHGSLSGQVLEILKKMDGPEIKPVIEKLQKTHIESYVKYAKERKEVWHPADSIETKLHYLLTDDIGGVLEEALKTKNVEKLAELLEENDKFDDLKEEKIDWDMQIVDTLVAIDTPESIKLLERLIDHPSSLIARVAIFTLLDRGYHPRAFKKLIEKTKIKENPMLWSYEPRYLERYITRCNDDDLIYFSKPEDLSGNDERLSQIAILALYARGYPPAILKVQEWKNGVGYVPRGTLAERAGIVGGDEMLPILKDLIVDQDTAVRSRAAESLGEIGAKSAGSILEERMDKEDEPYVLGEMLLSIGKTGCSKSAIPKLIEFCDHSDPRVRSGAAIALGKVGDESAIPILAGLLNDPHGGVIQAAGDAINQIDERMEREKIEFRE